MRPGNDEFPVDIVFTSEVALNANIVTPCLTRVLANPLECALTKNASANPLEYALTKSLDLKFLGMNTYKKGWGRGDVLSSFVAPAFRLAALRSLKSLCEDPDLIGPQRLKPAAKAAERY